VTGVTGLLFLGGGAWLGARLTLSRARAEELAAAKKRGLAVPLPAALEGPATVRALVSRELPGGQRLGNLGMRALAYGTVLCLCGATVATGVTAWVLEVRSLQQFSARMFEVMPRVRTKLEDALAPMLDLVADGCKAAVRASVPQIKGASLEEELEGLNSREKKAMREFFAWAGDEGAKSPPVVPSGGSASGGGSREGAEASK